MQNEAQLLAELAPRPATTRLAGRERYRGRAAAASAGYEDEIGWKGEPPTRVKSLGRWEGEGGER